MNRFVGQIGNLTPLIDVNGKPMYNKLLWHRIPLFEYRNVEPKVTYIDNADIQYQMDNHFCTDGGSIPPTLRLIPLAHLDPFNFPRSYLFHDCGYQYGGLYIKYPGENEFKFRLISHKEIDNMLLSTLNIEDATKYDIFIISLGVKVGSPFIWDEKKKPLLQREERRKNKINVYDKNGVIIEQNA